MTQAITKYLPNKTMAMKTSLCLVFATINLLSFAITASAQTLPQAVHGIAMHGEPIHSKDFRHYNFVNPNAPKGGRIVFHFDRAINSFNPFSIRGTPAPELTFWIFESLLDRSYDEEFALYARLAESVEMPENRKWLIFNINPKARFSDGHAVTAADVLFSYQSLKEKGKPVHRSYYGKVDKAQIIGKHRIRFDFKDGKDRELPLILSLMPILPKHIYEKRNITKSSLALPVGSGPYVLGRYQNSRFIEYNRNPNYWGKNLPTMQGRFNFDIIRFNIYTDSTVSIEALLAGDYDMRFVTSITELNNRYTEDTPAIRQGRLIKHGFKHNLPAGMRALVMNTRQPVFKDINIRRAFNHIFNFERINAALFANGYKRTQGFFDGSTLSSLNRTPTEIEDRLLADKSDNPAVALLDYNYMLPVSDNTVKTRQNLKKALKLLKKAGYIIKNNVMIHAKTKKPLVVELMLLKKYREIQKLALYFQKNLKKSGIKLNINIVDSSLYQKRLNNYDYDMIYYFWYASLSPGNEQKLYWHSDGYTTKGSRNYMGAKSKAIDNTIAALLSARTKESFIGAVRVIDRLLRANFYVIPLYHLESHFVILSTKIGFPDKKSVYGIRPESWWQKIKN